MNEDLPQPHSPSTESVSGGAVRSFVRKSAIALTYGSNPSASALAGWSLTLAGNIVSFRKRGGSELDIVVPRELVGSSDVPSLTGKTSEILSRATCEDSLTPSVATVLGSPCVP